MFLHRFPYFGIPSSSLLCRGLGGGSSNERADDLPGLMMVYCVSDSFGDQVLAVYPAMWCMCICHC